ncbi:hypothetical protein [Tessaracoccus coleopterorum]|uniref:hypothetical protein n=1 Tax=Tessaracoccus coleopterorum TaxID=2714950 RepID=UPI0018D4A317|nr:hypothetical protein [Tessaracoccus coleopterorum]
MRLCSAPRRSSSCAPRSGLTPTPNGSASTRSRLREAAGRARPSSHPWPRTIGARPQVPTSTGQRASRPISTQEGFGRILVDLSRDDGVRRHLVTTSPDVATSTNLAGWINRVGVFAEHERQTWSDDPLLRWRETPSGQHIELGISEMNLFLLLGQLGLAESFSDQRLLPVGTLYDPFVCRASTP